MAADVQPRIYTTRLQKGGALLDSLRHLTLVWNEGPGAPADAVSAIALPSRRRALDVVNRAFVPRMVESKPPRLWRLASALEHSGADRSLIVPLHYYAAACSEPLLWDFVVEELYPRAGSDAGVSTQDVLAWLNRRPAEFFGGRRWTTAVCTKVARGLLAALRDYGVLKGASKKRISGLYLSVSGFALIARVRDDLGIRGAAAVKDDVWKLFFLSQAAVERFFAEANAAHLLQFDSIGSVIRIEYPNVPLEEYATVITRGSTHSAAV